MTVSKEAPKIDLNFDSGEDTFKLLGDPVNRDSLNFSFDTSAIVSSPTTALSPTTTSTTTDLAQLDSPVIKSAGRRSTFDPLAIAEHQLQLQNEQEQQLKGSDDTKKVQTEEGVRGQQEEEVDPLTKNQQQQQQQQKEQHRISQQDVSPTTTPSAVTEGTLTGDGSQTTKQDAATADAAVKGGSPAHTDAKAKIAPEQTNTAITTSESTAIDSAAENIKTRTSIEVDDAAAATATTTAATAVTTTAAATTAAAAGTEKKISSELNVVSNEPAKQPAMSSEKPSAAAPKQNPEPEETKSCFCF